MGIEVSNFPALFSIGNIGASMEAVLGKIFSQGDMFSLAGHTLALFANEQGLVRSNFASSKTSEVVSFCVYDKSQAGLENDPAEELLRRYIGSGSEALVSCCSFGAFCLFDAKAQKIYFYSDILGRSTLYYYLSSDRFLLASSIASIMAALPSEKRALNQSALFDSFSFGFIPGAESSFQGINKVPRGCLSSLKLFDGALESQELEEEFALLNEPPIMLKKGYQAQITAALRDELNVCADQNIALLMNDQAAASGVLQHCKVFSGTSITLEMEDESSSFAALAHELGSEVQNEMAVGVSVKDFGGLLCAYGAPIFNIYDVAYSALASAFVSSFQDGRVILPTGADITGGSGFNNMSFLYDANALITKGGLKMFRSTLLEMAARISNCKPDHAAILVRTLLKSGALDKNARFYPSLFPYWQMQDSAKQGLFRENFQSSFAEGGRYESMLAHFATFEKAVRHANSRLLFDTYFVLPETQITAQSSLCAALGVSSAFPFLAATVLKCALSRSANSRLLNYGKYSFTKSQAVKVSSYGSEAPQSWLWETKEDFVREMLSPNAIDKVGVFDPQVVTEQLIKYETNETEKGSFARTILLRNLNGVLSTQILHYCFVEGRAFL